MIELVIYSLIMMLSGILAYEVLKYLTQNLRDYRTRKECDKFEDRAFHRCLTGSLDHAFKELSYKDAFSYMEEVKRLERQKARSVEA